MNKENYINKLRVELKHRNIENIDDIISDYEDLIFHKIKEGRSEEEVLIDLGNVEELANSYGELNISELHNLEIDLDSIENICVKTSDLIVKKGNDNKVFINHGVDYFIEGNKLNVESDEKKKCAREANITIITNKAMNQLDISAVNVEITESMFKEVVIKGVNVKIENNESCILQKLDAKTVNFKSVLKHLTLNNLKVITTNSDLKFDCVNANNISINGLNAEAIFKNCVVDVLEMKHNVIPSLKLCNTQVGTLTWGKVTNNINVDSESIIKKLVN